LLAGHSLDDAMELIDKNTIESLISLKTNLYRRASGEKIDTVFEKCGQVVVSGSSDE